MKKISFLIVVLCITFSCKKKDATTNNTNTTPQAVTTYSIDGVAVTNLTHTSFKNDSAHFGVVAYGANANPEIQIIFSGTVAPTYGTYQMTTGNVTYAKCSLTLSDTNYHSTASAGYINVVTSGTAPNNVATFTNIAVSGGLGNHVVSGTITY